ncbi:protein kinase [Nocardia sp. NPDC050406]|uniref:serine/threonine-protein kinase n=1 Tax=Nocardia sp. NPDC050406 TaxID=3364318 RepID=UPI0037A7445D
MSGTRGLSLGDGRLGRYRLDELLGSGGTGQVWRAHDTMTDRTVALKVLAPALANDPAYRRRFEREAKAVARLRGPHVVPLHHFGEVEGRLFIETAYIDGVDLESLLEWEGPRTPAAAVELIAQIATALDEAHAAKLIHRDVKPSNIMVGHDDAAYLIDFGTAQQDGQAAMTLTGMVIGTPAYMAPERFTGHTTPRSDIYSLACVLYECLTGERPFRERNPARLMHAHVTTEPPRASDTNPAVPRRLNEVIARGMAKNPAERHASAGEFAAAARAALKMPTVDPPTLALPPVAAAGASPPPAATVNAGAPPIARPKPEASPVAAAGADSATEPLGRVSKSAAAQRGTPEGQTSVIPSPLGDRGRPVGVVGPPGAVRGPHTTRPDSTVRNSGTAGAGGAAPTGFGSAPAKPNPKGRRPIAAGLAALAIATAIIGVTWRATRDTTPPTPSVIPSPVESPAHQPIPTTTTAAPPTTTWEEPPPTTTAAVQIPYQPIPTPDDQPGPGNQDKPDHKPDDKPEKPDKPNNDKPNKPR